jgi:fumarylacetoacetase
MIDATHDPALQSWVASANSLQTDFPIQNLPFGRFFRAGEGWRAGVAIGDQILDLAVAHALGQWTQDVRDAMVPLASGDLNAFMALGVQTRRAVRQALSEALAVGGQPSLAAGLVLQGDVEMGLPCHIGDYTDFYVGIHHATAVGKLFRPDNPLLPNYKWVPIGYHGRASTILASGKPFVRPCGQLMAPGAEQPRLAPTQRLDFELELGVVIGQGNSIGTPITLDKAEEHVFGLTLFNDWSARDIQAWEYQPLGPFLSKNFASTLSPWIVTMEALAPFRRPFRRPEGDPPPLQYLDSECNRDAGAFDIALDVQLQTLRMREAGQPAVRISQSNFADAAYWTVAQLVAHHTVNGCALTSGDLFGTGTLSGAKPEQAGSLLELTQGGKQVLTLPGGEERLFLQDGDSLRLSGRCVKAGWRSIGFGQCEATILPALG